MKSLTAVEKQIFATIVYYDILDYPLTSFDVFFYLIRNKKRCGLYKHKRTDSNAQQSSSCQFFEVVEALDSSKFLKDRIDEKFGLYFLRGRDNIVQKRLDRKKIANHKWKKAKKILWVMQIIPFIKMMLVSGSLALGNSREESDIDLIIISKRGRIWTVRTFATLLVAILGARRSKNKTKNKICLNHYITEKSLRIPFESLYNAESYIHLVNVYDNSRDRELHREFQKENKWIKDYVENCKFSDLGSLRSIKRNKALGFVSRFFETVLSGKLGDFLEKKLSELQSVKIKKDSLYCKNGGRVTISDEQLEFHPDSHENYIIPEFNRRMKKLGLLEFANQKDSGLNHSS